MHTTTDQISQHETCYHGLRMTAEEYFQLGETYQRYELIDGVICLSPGASAPCTGGSSHESPPRSSHI